MDHRIGNARQCPFCAGQELRDFAVETDFPDAGPRRVEVIECRDCLTAWQGPTVFTDSETKAFYAAQYAKKELGTYFDKDKRRDKADLQVDFVESSTTGIGTLLDIGAGDGAFVDAAISRGWKARGVDLSHSSTHVVLGTIDDIAGTFDVITMWDVIEHVEDPADAISQASARLTDGGTLVIETGNYVSVDRIMADRNWWGFHPDHRWFHAPTIIETLLRRAGFSHFNYAATSLRPHAPPAAAPYTGPSRLESLLRILKRPHRVGTIIRQFHELQISAQRCPALSHISIVAVAAGKSAPAQ